MNKTSDREKLLQTERQNLEFDLRRKIGFFLFLISRIVLDPVNKIQNQF